MHMKRSKALYHSTGNKYTVNVIVSCAVSECSDLWPACFPNINFYFILFYLWSILTKSLQVTKLKNWKKISGGKLSVVQEGLQHGNATFSQRCQECMKNNAEHFQHLLYSGQVLSVMCLDHMFTHSTRIPNISRRDLTGGQSNFSVWEIWLTNVHGQENTCTNTEVFTFWPKVVLKLHTL